jgi:hypothetical protein
MDDDFTSSDDSDQYDEQKVRSKYPEDEIFFDPAEDEADARWVMENLHSQSRFRKRASTGKVSPHDDVVRSNAASVIKKTSISSDTGFFRPSALSCPGCFSILTLDCQRHVDYHNQFRAMFVRNCRVNMDRPMQVRQVDTATANASSHQGDGIDSETFYPVACVHCDASLGMMDTDDIYHFVDVLVTENDAVMEEDSS